MTPGSAAGFGLNSRPSRASGARRQDLVANGTLFGFSGIGFEAGGARA